MVSVLGISSASGTGKMNDHSGPVFCSDTSFRFLNEILGSDDAAGQSRARVCHFLAIENDPLEALLLQKAFSRITPATTVAVCRSLSEAKAYLSGAGMYANRQEYPVPQAIICDLHLELETGFEFLLWLAGQTASKAIPVFILTGSSSPAEIARAYSLGATEVLQKPMELTELSTMLDQLAEVCKVGGFRF
jgi:CheY-like chemotaxis protein